MSDASETKASEIRFYRAAGEYGWMSNLFKLGLIFEGKAFSCREAAYQYGKPIDRATADWIVAAPKPHLMAIAAHGLFVFDVKANWNDLKVPRMRAVLLAFFRQHNDMRNRLLETGDAALIEESKSDAFWGLGKKGNGKNMLGVLLMEVRSLLRTGMEPK